jgi:hypothetical protein
MVPDGQGGEHERETIFTFAYWKEFFKMEHLPNFNQTWNKHFLHDGQMKVEVLFKEGIITKIGKGHFNIFFS